MTIFVVITSIVMLKPQHHMSSNARKPIAYILSDLAASLLELLFDVTFSLNDDCFEPFPRWRKSNFKI